MGIRCQVLISSPGTIRRCQSVQKHTTINFDARGALASVTSLTEHSELEATHRAHGVQPLLERPIRGSDPRPVPSTPRAPPGPARAQRGCAVPAPGPERAPRSARAGTQPGNADPASLPRAVRRAGPSGQRGRAPGSHRRRAGRRLHPVRRPRGEGGSGGPRAQPARRHARPPARFPSARLQQRRDTNAASGCNKAPAVAALEP